MILKLVDVKTSGDIIILLKNYPMTYTFFRQGRFEDEEIAAAQADDLIHLEKSLAKAYSVKSPAICQRDIIYESGYYAGLHRLLENKSQTEEAKRMSEWLVYSDKFELQIIRFKNEFKKQYKKLKPKAQSQFEERFRFFLVHPSDPRLRLHPLKNILTDHYSINISGDLRAIFAKDEVVMTFVLLGNHAQLYHSQAVWMHKKGNPGGLLLRAK